MMRVALYPGSFDPLTLGHLELISRMSRLFDEVVVGILVNPGKTPYLPAEVRLESIRQSVKEMPNVRVVHWEGPTVELARQVGACAMVRGLRSVTDFEYESTLAAGYRYMAPEIETLFLPAKAEYSTISSSLVREIHALGGDVAMLVPPPVLRSLAEKNARKEKQS